MAVDLDAVVRRAGKIDRKHDIPYLAGYSRDGKTIYIDRHMPPSFRYRGREINTTGDGFLATFDSAGAALLCGLAAADATRQLGIEIRVGVHTGEIEFLADDIRGLAVHSTARIMAAAQASEVFASSITCTLAESTGLRFETRGSHVLKGFEAPMELFAVSRAVETQVSPTK